jgi:hypothetical protein
LAGIDFVFSPYHECRKFCGKSFQRLGLYFRICHLAAISPPNMRPNYNNRNVYWRGRRVVKCHYATKGTSKNMKTKVVSWSKRTKRKIKIFRSWRGDDDFRNRAVGAGQAMLGPE